MMANAKNAEKRLETMLGALNKAQLAELNMDEFGFKIDLALPKKDIIAEFLKRDGIRRNAKMRDDTIQLTETQVKEIEVKAVAAYKVDHAKVKPVPVDISENTQLKTKLAAMNKEQLIKFGTDEFSLKIEPILTEKVIIENLLRLDNIRRGDATKVNEESLLKSISADDPPIRVKFFNLQSPAEVINFSFAGPKGMRGPINKTGHAKCPKYELYPGEEYTLPLSLKEHLESLTFTHYKTIIDTLTGQVAGNVPILKPKYILNPIISKEQLLALQTK